MNIRCNIIWFSALLIILSACGPSAQEITQKTVTAATATAAAWTPTPTATATSTPTPTIPPTPTATPTPIPADDLLVRSNLTVEESNQEAIKQAQELALRLSGENDNDCGGTSSWEGKYDFNPEFDYKTAYYFEVNDCALDAFQKKQAFRIGFSKLIVDTEDHYWIIGTPEGKIFLVYASTGFMGGSCCSEKQCLEPKISTFDDVMYLVCKKDP